MPSQNCWRGTALRGLIEKAVSLWGKAGQRSLERSALVEAIAQLARALDLIAILPATPALRRQQIKLQVALITPVTHIKGHAAPETKAAAERARLLIEQAEALGEAPEDPLLIFSVLYGLWATNAVAFNGDALRELAMQLLALAQKQGTTAARLVAHRAMGISLVYTGEFIEAREHLEQTIVLYDPAEHRPLAMRFITDLRVHALSYRSWTLLFLGKPDAALVDAERAVIEAREIAQAAVLMNALTLACFTHTFCRSYPAATNQLDELVALADEKGSLYWKVLGMLLQGCVLAGTGKAAESVSIMATWLSARRSTGSTSFIPFWSSHLAIAHAQLGEFSEARRCIAEATAAVKNSKERWFEAEVHRIAGETALLSREPEAAKTHFDHALAVARQQQAKSWELRASMSLARLWRDQGKTQQARELLAPVYGWFTEGFDTRDLKEAKALLEELAA
jgi:predicted ATPase